MSFHSEKLIAALTEKARNLKVQALKMIYKAESGHPGGSLSAADIITALYFHHLNLNPAQPYWSERDRFILSKGHAAPILYAALAERGYFPKKELDTLRSIGSILQGHPDLLKTPGVEMTTGILGHGLSVGVGMALGAKLDHKNYRIYVLLGDGELDTGFNWEAALSAHKYHLDNLTAIVDLNGVQLDGPTNEIMPLEPVVDKWKSFNWYALEIDGHNIKQILDTLDETKHLHGKPSIIIAHTIKGKGVSFMENKSIWHGRVPNKEEFEIALKELQKENDNG
jgi:transketolase